ncbi:HNH endonuclease domain-containing protein [Extensimonas perlucida]|jgi:Uncharacterized protein conserved in bacteria|uniref:HNH endonuclease domain-containing protein n=1 Tax=Extensimonas perlucida TaxID=2590786 RepID=UPI00119F3B3A|nr:HNH endonuclease domain-containing protein [Extensimonas perlucida]
MKRQLTDSEKFSVRQQQLEPDGSLRCFISGEVISANDEVEYDHIQPFSKDGDTAIANIRIVLKHHNRRKSNQSLYDVRDNLRLERLFESKKNHIKLQDILDLKDVKRRNTHCTTTDGVITIDDGTLKRTFTLLSDSILHVNYFYGRVPISWLENDDQEGLQPRVIDYKRLINIRDHLKIHPQLAPSIARLLGNRLKLFDGQHKLAAQVLNNNTEADIKVYVSPDDPASAKRLFDDLMITNLEAHSKLKQVPFYTSTLLDRLSVIYRELLDEFISTKAPESHTEEHFVHFLTVTKQYSKTAAKDMLRGAIKTAALAGSALEQYVAEASKDASYPITIDLLEKTIFPATLYLDPATAKFTSDQDYRNAETQNFAEIAKLIVAETMIANWAQNIKGKTLTHEQLKARRIWHKGAVLTWAPYLKSILYFALQAMTSEERERLLYRKPISDHQKAIIQKCLNRLFSHPLWDEPEGEVDSLLVSARKQDDLFSKKGLTEKYVIYGEA